MQYSESAPLHFEHKLKKETALLKKWFENGKISEQPQLEIGFELECFIVGKTGKPSLANQKLLDQAQYTYLIPELCQYNLEINALPLPLQGNALETLHHNLQSYLNQVQYTACQHHLTLLTMGCLPNVTRQHHKTENLTQKKRYRTIDNTMRSLCQQGMPVYIQHHDILSDFFESLAVNGNMCSFQIHLRVPASQAVRYYNAAQIAAGPLLAMSANSPFFMGKNLWSETRIPLFEQIMNSVQHYKNTHPCALFGHQYLQHSFYTLFEENLLFPRLYTPYLHTPEEKMQHVCMQNGISYRWNRPVIDCHCPDNPHIRIEFRPLPSGPTCIDMITNAALYVGLVQALATTSRIPEQHFPFWKAKHNFYTAAKNGLQSTLYWQNHPPQPINQLFFDYFLPLAQSGLLDLDLLPKHVNIVLAMATERIKKQQSGAAWQRQFHLSSHHDFAALTEAYFLNQRLNKPVAQWATATA